MVKYPIFSLILKVRTSFFYNVRIDAGQAE
nr:MAG TPA: hypothetical protein [Bacteriophage sp.]